VRTHVHGPVPFAACGTGIESDHVDRFCEAAADSGGMRFEKGHTLMPYLVDRVRRVTSDQ
jgi:2,3-bisphosphoglycerate-independent phosphoglycerate mutase